MKIFSYAEPIVGLGPCLDKGIQGTIVNQI